MSSRSLGTESALMAALIAETIVNFMKRDPRRLLTGEEIFCEAAPAFREDAIAFAMGGLWTQGIIIMVGPAVSFEAAEWKLKGTY